MGEIKERPNLAATWSYFDIGLSISLVCIKISKIAASAVRSCVYIIVRGQAPGYEYKKQCKNEGEKRHEYLSGNECEGTGYERS